MNIAISPVKKIRGNIITPSSKSLTHRAIICAVLASGVSVIDNILLSDDTLKTIEACRSFGITITQKKDKLTIVGNGGILKAPKNRINVGESGTTLRFVTALAALTKGKTMIRGIGRIPDRPMKELSDALEKLDGDGKIEISGNTSSQFISALLLIAPFTKKKVEIIIKDVLVSEPYVSLTLEVMKHFGVSTKNENFKRFVIPADQRYKAANYSIEGDFSSASYFFAAAAVTGGEVIVSNLSHRSKQGDAVFLDLLQKMGCQVFKKDSVIKVIGSKNLHGIDVDMGSFPDLAPSLSTVAAGASGTTRITNIKHLRHKESDRIETIKQEFRKMGVVVNSDKTSLSITGGIVKGGIVDSHNDHRIAMSLAILGLNGKKETIIQHAEVVSKSYPEFFNDLKKVGVSVKEVS